MNVHQKILNVYDSLTRQNQKVADFIINNVDDVIYHPIAKLVDAIGVSNATIVRFAQQLGFKGFTDFRDALFDYYREYLSPEARMQHSIESVQNMELSYGTITKREIGYLEASIGTINEESFQAAIEELCKANTLYIYGSGANEHLACYLHFRLRRLKFNCRFVSASGREMLEHFLNLKADDATVVYNFSRPSPDFLRLMHLMKDKKVPTILITDIRTPPMIRMATHVLYAERGPRGTFPSPIVPMAVTFALLRSIEDRFRDKAVEALKTLGELRNKYFYSDRF
ncbi:MAG: hypothetical protein DRP87_12860 [Spirochaetes bacterium]|nr:MAG: hypothetical protein DRP87_12860 [Spirochaetota bacterium]